MRAVSKSQGVSPERFSCNARRIASTPEPRLFTAETWLMRRGCTRCPADFYSPDSLAQAETRETALRPRADNCSSNAGNTASTTGALVRAGPQSGFPRFGLRERVRRIEIRG